MHLTVKKGTALVVGAAGPRIHFRKKLNSLTSSHINHYTIHTSANVMHCHSLRLAADYGVREKKQSSETRGFSHQGPPGDH